MSKPDKIKIQEEPVSCLDNYGMISIAFEVKSLFELSLPDGELGGFVLREKPVPRLYIKDYDSIGPEHPSDWPKRFDTTNWGFLLARSELQPVGGATLAYRTMGLGMLDGRDDLAVIWDIRVAPEWRGRRVGSALFAACESWARERGCRWLKI